MTRSTCLLALLLGAANVGGDLPSSHAARCQAVAEARRPASAGYRADVEVCLGGVTRHGRLIVTCDGCVHLEHLDEQARRWACGLLIRRGPSAAKGWDDRAGPVRRVWCRLGEENVLTEAHTPDGSLKLSHHKLLAAR
jgi:hypothetical protein